MPDKTRAEFVDEVYQPKTEVGKSMKDTMMRIFENMDTESAPSQPRDGTSSPSGIAGQGG